MTDTRLVVFEEHLQRARDVLNDFDRDAPEECEFGCALVRSYLDQALQAKRRTLDPRTQKGDDPA